MPKNSLFGVEDEIAPLSRVEPSGDNLNQVSSTPVSSLSVEMRVRKIPTAEFRPSPPQIAMGASCCA
jgi:hypothetical protein